MTKQKEQVYLSFDIEADGQAPGLNSMMSFGMVIITYNKKIIWEFERVLKPLSDAKTHEDTMIWWKKEENKKAFEYSTSNQVEPEKAFKQLYDEIVKLQEKYTIYAVAAPAAYDWQWINYYFWRFIGKNPLGHSCSDVNSYYWAMKKSIGRSTKELWEKYKEKGFDHTHKPLDDAKEQGMQFINALRDNTQ